MCLRNLMPTLNKLFLYKTRRKTCTNCYFETLSYDRYKSIIYTSYEQFGMEVHVYILMLITFFHQFLLSPCLSTWNQLFIILRISCIMTSICRGKKHFRFTNTSKERSGQVIQCYSVKFYFSWHWRLSIFHRNVRFIKLELC